MAQVKHRQFAHGCLPNVIIIGAMKSATTSLHFYLNQYPQVCMSDPKELNFFLDQNWPKGLDWYASHFCGQGSVFGETSPNYSKRHLFSDVPERMYSVLPEARLIYVLRDPVERILSHYTFNCLSGIEHRDFEDAVLKTPHNGYVQTSRYYMQLEAFLIYYPLDQIRIVTCENLKADGLNVMNDLADFLCIDAFDFMVGDELNRSIEKKQRNLLGCFLHRQPWVHRLRWALPQPFVSLVRNLTQFHTTVQKPLLSVDAKQRLIEWLYKDVEKLRDVTGLELKNWCV